MAAVPNVERQYFLTIINASDIRNIPARPALYVTVAISENKVCKTTTVSSAAPSWDHPCSLIVESSSVLSFRLKCDRGRLRHVLVVGSVSIGTADLLGRCDSNKQTTLALLDNRSRQVGLLVVRLQAGARSVPHRVVETAEHVARGNFEENTSNTPHSSIQNPIESVTKQDFDNNVVQSLGRVVYNIQAVMDEVPETSRLRPYVNIALRVMCLAHQTTMRQVERAKVLHDLIASMVGLYSIVEDGDFNRKIQDLDGVIIRIAVQTIECGIFVQQYMNNTAPQAISKTKRIVSELSEALKLLKAELGPGVTSPTDFVSAQGSWDASRQVEIATLKAQLDPANMKMDVEHRETCLPETRENILQELFVSLTVPNPSHHVIWLRGLAGSGKSTILNTMAQCFSKLHRRGAFLFWDRNDAVNSDPRRVIRTLAYQLACFNPAFAQTLVSRVNMSPSIIESPLDEQFRCLVEEPLASLAARHDLGPIIIILDAVDECGTRETRKKLLDALSIGLAKLPTMFRLIIASRDEPDIRVSISRLDIAVRDLRIDDDRTKLDILRLFQRRLVDTPAFVDYDLPTNWPGDGVVRRLVDRAQGLFISASTSIRFIESGDPEERLNKVLSASAHGEPHHKLDDLYRVALVHPFDSSDQSELDAVHSILGAIVVAREPLTDEQLGELLGLKLGTVRGILSRLQPLLLWSRGKSAQPLHTSFTDFLCDPGRCHDPQWHTDISTHHYILASCCLQLMQQKLKFNICGIETSHRRHQEIEGIQERIDQAITHVLMYASQYWADHLALGSSSEPDLHLVDEVMDFVKNRLLFWIEVFSLKNQMSRPSIILRRATDWAKNYNAELEAVISGGNKFVGAFGCPISQSLPHMYISALPFLPSESAVLQHMCTAFQNTLSVEAGKSAQWPVVRQTFMGHSNEVLSVAFSPDSTRIVSGSCDKTVRIWDAVSGAPIGEPLGGHFGPVTSVTFSPDGTRIISGSDDRTIRLWHVMSGAPIGDPLKGHFDAVSSIAYSPDGTRIASGSLDGTVQIWDAVSCAAIREPLKGHSGPVRCVGYSPDGTRIASGSGDKTVRMWNALSGALIGRPLQGHSCDVMSLAFSPNGALIVSGSDDRTIQIWDAVSGVPIGEPLRGHTYVKSVAFSPDGTRIVSGSSDCTIRIWDTVSGAPIGMPLRGHSNSVWSIACSPDGTRIVSGSEDNTVRVWGAVSGIPRHEPLQQHSDSVWSIAYSPDGTRIASGSGGRTIRIWDAVSGAPVGEPLHGHYGDVRSIAFSHDGTRIVSGSQDTTIRIWDAALGAPIREPLRGHTDVVRSVAYSPDGTHIVSGSNDKTIRIWGTISAPIGKLLQGHSGYVMSVAYCPDGTRVVSCSSDNTIRIWDAVSGTPIGQLQGPFSRARSVAYSPDSTRIVSGCKDGTIQIWNAVSRTPIGEPLHGHLGDVYTVAFSSNGMRVVSGSDDNTVRIWDAMSGASIGELQGHSSVVTSVAFSPNGTCVASASMDNTIRIWDASTRPAICSSERHSSLTLTKTTASRKIDPPNCTPIFPDRPVLHTDGWLTTPGGSLLFWVPPEQRPGMLLHPTLVIIGAQQTRINLDRFVHGPQWALCHTNGS